jgi:hypothetical protein
MSVGGRVDFDRNVRREIVEETGLSLDDVTTDPWLLVLAPQRVALIKVFRFRRSASEMRASILDHLQKETLSELSDVHIVRDPSDLFATPPISNRRCLHSSARFFCIFGLATASDDVGFCSGRRHGRGFRCDVTSEEIRLVCAA